MEKELADYLKRQARLANDQANPDFTPTAAPMAVTKIKSCMNNKACIEYASDDLGLTWNWFAENFIANYCCEECKLYAKGKHN